MSFGRVKSGPPVCDNEGFKNLDRSSILYSCPLCVCENIRCVRGTVCVAPLGPLSGTGSVRTSLRGVSLIPMTICAGESVSCGTAPAYKDCWFDSRLSRCAVTHLLQFSHGKDSPLAWLYQYIDSILPHELVYRFRSEWATSFPDPSGVFATNTNSKASRG